MLAQNNTGRRTMKLVDHALKSIVRTHCFGRLAISPLRAWLVRRYSTGLNWCNAWLLGARLHHQVRLWPADAAAQQSRPLVRGPPAVSAIGLMAARSRAFKWRTYRLALVW
jgi:hypothetical protein